MLTQLKVSTFFFAVCVLSWSGTTSSNSAVSCNNPKATVTSFSTQDATILTELAHIGEFSIKCSNTNTKPLVLYGQFPCGKVIPVAQVGENKYQISWTEDIRKGSSGAVVVRLFDEEGYAQLRKVQRDGGNVSKVKSMLDITINTVGAYKGPWVRAELIAAVFGSMLAYYALTTKSKVQA